MGTGYVQKYPRESILLYSLSFLLGIALLAGIQSLPLRDYRETRLAEIGREILASGEWLVPQLNGSPFLDKPPLVPWLEALSFAMLGLTEGAARLPSALATLATACIVGWVTRRLFGRGKGVLGALLFLGTPGVHYYGRMLMTDTIAMACILAATAAFLEGYLRQQAGWYRLGCLVCGLGVLARGPFAAVYPFGALGLFLLWSDRRAWRSVPWGTGLLLFLVVTAPWFVLTEQAYPGFLHLIFVQHHIERLLPHAAHPFVAISRGEILLSLAGFLGPLSVILPWVSGTIQGQQKTHRLLWILALLVVGSVLLSTGRNHPYTLPALPPLVILAAGGLGAITDTSPALRRYGPALLLGLGGLTLLGLLPWLGVLLPKVSSLLGNAEIRFVIQYSLGLVGGLFLTGSVFLWLGRGAQAGILCAAIMLPAGWMLTHVQQQMALRESRAFLATHVRQDVPPTWPLIIADPGDHLFEGTGGWGFYAHRQVFMVAFAAPDPVAFHGAGRPAWILDMEDMVALQRSGKPFALVTTSQALAKLPFAMQQPSHAQDKKFTLWLISGQAHPSHKSIDPAHRR